ncbi:hypothetical protein [Pseudomonas aeruginosa]|uniref:hypothetical protein n=1 Tax=Pseudomonas aeruginosa TaxID=287 RepID=UPI0019310FBC|nr:hypothetical protein [Pseudomonas aeruginosa]
MNKANECTCPSGDGSLVHPCPAHPAVEQAGANVGHGHVFPRADGVKMRCGGPGLCSECAADAYRARAALAQPSPTTDSRPAEWSSYDPTWVVDFIRDNSIFNADLIERMLEYATRPAGDVPQAEQAEAERPEVVAYADPVAFATFKERGHEGGVAGREWMWAEPGAALVAMSRTDECERIVGALREQYECNTAIMHARTEALSRVTSERDAALSRVAELEKQEPVATVAKVPGEDWNSLDFHRDLQDMQPGTKLYAAPLAQAQQLHDLDKQCRDDVARALGLRPNKERGFAWSYLLASIKSCVKASGDSAQAQHSVPEGWKLVPVEPTEDVLEAIHNGGYVGDDQELRWFYQSILAAAPAPGGE